MMVLITTLAMSATESSAQEDPIFNGADAKGGSDQDNPTVLDGYLDSYWEGGLPPDGDLEGDGNLTFKLNEDDEDLSWFNIQFETADISWEKINNLTLDSRSQVLFTSSGVNSIDFEFVTGAEVNAGEGAMWFDSGYFFNATGDLEFIYGNGGGEDDAELIEYRGTSVTSSAAGLSFNLIIEGALGEGGDPGDTSNGTITFSGGGKALLTGGASFNTDSNYELVLTGGSSLMLGGATSYTFSDGLNASFAGGSLSEREEGRGILQLIDGATLDAEAGVEVSGFGAIIIGELNLDDLNDLDLNLGLDEHIVEGSVTSTLDTDTLTLSGDATVVVAQGAGSQLTVAEATNMSGSAELIVMQDALANLGKFEMTGGTVVNQGQMNFNTSEDTPALITGGLFRSYGVTNFDNGLSMNSNTFEVLGGTTTATGSADNSITFGPANNLTVKGGSMVLTSALDVETTFNLDGTILIDGTGPSSTMTVGVDKKNTTEIGQQGRVTVKGENASLEITGGLEVSGQLALEDGAQFTYTWDDTQESDTTILELTNGTLAGGNSEEYDSGTNAKFDFSSYNPESELLSVGTLISGVFDEQSGEFGANYGTLEIELGTSMNLDLSDSDVIFYVSADDSNGNTNPFIELTGGDGAEFSSGTSIEVAITGDEYIPSGTEYVLFNKEDILSGNQWDEVTFDGFNTVTRGFAPSDIAGTVSITADYIAPAQGGGTVVQQRGAWLQQESDTLGATDLLVLLDQIGSVGQYQNAVGRLGPESIASGLQVVSDTNAFNAYHEALSDMRTGNELGRPGPARRPLSQSSQSLLASQDEGDTIRSQYGYGSGPASGERRQEDDNMVAFVQGYYRTINLDNMSNVIGVDGNQWGVLAGVGGQLSENTVLGLLVGYDDFTGDLNDDYGSVDVGTVRAGPFFGWADENWNVDLALTGGYNDWNGTRRNNALPGAPSYNWSTGGWQIDFSSGLGYRIPLGGGVNLIPEGSFVYSFIQTDSYTEQGTKAGTLQVDTNDLNSVIGRLGASVEVISIAGLILEGRLGWQGNYSFGGDLETGVLGGGSPLPGTPDQVDRNNVYYGGQITWMPTWDVSLSFRYEGRSLDGTNDQYFGGGVSFEF
jgi:hypothetical protein